MSDTRLKLASHLAHLLAREEAFDEDFSPAKIFLIRMLGALATPGRPLGADLLLPHEEEPEWLYPVVERLVPLIRHQSANLSLRRLEHEASRHGILVPRLVSEVLTETLREWTHFLATSPTDQDAADQFDPEGGGRRTNVPLPVRVAALEHQLAEVASRTRAVSNQMSAVMMMLHDLTARRDG